MKKLLIIIITILAGVSPALHAQSTERIITAGSAVTETVCALGDCDKIIASDRTSLYPEKIQSLPSIGYRSGINAEGILSMKPTLVIAEKDYVEEAVLQQLAAASVKLLIIERKYQVEDTRKFITQIASVLKREAEAKKLIAKIDHDLEEAKLLLERKATTPRVVCVYNRGASTISAGGKETFGEILEYAGATNAFQELDGYKPLNTEALIAANPDYIVMLSSGFQSIGGMDGVLKIPGVALTTAGKKEQVVAIDGLKLTNFGPRLGEAVKELVRALHPELQAK